MIHLRRLLAATLLTLGIVGTVAGTASGQTPSPTATTTPDTTTPTSIVSLTLNGVVDPFEASYLKSGIESAQTSGASAVLITIDTPGGLDSSMREITQAILDSDVPVICYTAPSGARAASAGTFVMLSCPVASMAPGTNIGAAHPVGLVGAIESEKATNDAAAYIRGLADHYGRNADWAEQAVRNSVSITADQALAQGVIDYIAPSTDALLTEVNGTEVTLGDGSTVTVDLGSPTLDEQKMNPVFGFLHSLLNPNVAFIFFWFGLALIILELFIPGGVVGAIGGIMLILAIAAFGMLPIQLAGVALLIMSVVFFAIELKHPGVGVPAIGGVACLIAGGLLLFSPSVPNSQVSPWVIVPLAILSVAFFTVVVKTAIKQRKFPPPKSHAEQMIGQEGTVSQVLDPEGVVQVASETWSAVSEKRVPKGRRVRVVDVSGLRLKVEPVSVGSANDDKGDD